MSEQRLYCTFFIDNLRFGLDVQKVQEVVPYQEMTRVPLAPPTVRGLLNLRGQIVTGIDLRRRLDLPEAAPGSLPMNVVLRGEDSPVSFLVDEVGEVIGVAAGACERPPETLQGRVRDLIQGVYPLEDELLLVLDTVKTLDLHQDTSRKALDDRARGRGLEVPYGQDPHYDDVKPFPPTAPPDGR